MGLNKNMKIIGYKGGQIIVIPPKGDDQLARLMILLGSKKAGNTADILEETTGLLSALLKDKKIDSRAYKKFMKMAKVPILTTSS